jgi:hypothetical protein
MLAGVLAVGAFALAGFLYFLAPGLVVSDSRLATAAHEGQLARETERLDARNAARTTGIQLIGVLVVVIGSVLTWRTVRLTREGQITDRYAAAIQNLSAEKPMSVQIGSIFALERLARDSRRDHWPVMEILIGVLRERAPAPVDAVAEHEVVSVPAEVQAIATVISRRRARWDGRHNTMRLEGLDLRSVRLTGADLRSANLSESELSGAFLERARLDGAKLLASKMRGTHLDGARAHKAQMRGADFTGARLRGVDFRRSTFGRNEWEGADTEKARGLPHGASG